MASSKQHTLHTTLLQQNQHLLADAYITALKHNLHDFVILFMDLRDNNAKQMLVALEEAFGRRINADKYIADCTREGKTPIVCHLKEREVVRDWFKHDMPDVGTALASPAPAEIVYGLIVAGGSTSVAGIPRVSLGVVVDPSESEKDQMGDVI